MKKILTLMLVLLILVLSCKTNEDENFFQSSSLPGMIYDGDNRPCKKVLIRTYRVNELDELILTVESDINGRFTLPDLDRGTYRIEVEKDGYEAMATEINYSSPLEVLYLKMFSQDQILKLAEDALDVRRFGQVRDLLLRSQKIDELNPYHLFMEAVYLYEKDDFEASIESLDQIISQGYDFPYVYLLKGDIYQYELIDNEKAIEALKIVLSLIDDEQVNNRLKELAN